MKTRAILVWTATLFALSTAQSIVVSRTVPNPIANFDLSYIDISLQGAGPTLFQLQLLPPPGGATTNRYHIDFRAHCESSIVTGLLLHARSGEFAIPPGGIAMSSNEFFTDRGDTAASLHRTIDRLAERRAQEILLGSGLIPSGRVTMTFQLIDAARQTAVSQSETWFDIVAVRYVKPISPGIDARQSPERIPESFSGFPQFVWSSDLMPIAYPPGSIKFVVSVFENLSGGELSDITDSRPLWVDTIPGESSVNFAQYPSSGARALTPGQTYYWQVRAVLQGPVSRDVASELYAFRVGNLEGAGMLSPAQQMLLRYLAMILGSNYGYVMEQLRGMTIPERAQVNGSPADMEQLAKLAEEFALGKRTVTHVELK